MRIISGQEQFQTEAQTAVAIGKFDGMHLGHQFLIRELVKGARAEAERAMKTVVFTFDPSPRVFFSGKPEPEIFTKEEKRAVFASLDVDILLEFPMNARTAAMSPEAFVEEVLCRQLHAGLVIAGGDLSFGHMGKGNFALLEAFAGDCGFHTKRIEKVLYRGEPISSSRIREAVRAADMEEAAGMLGAPYTVTGTVRHGRHLGHTLGFPTINLVPPPEKLLPPYGVYTSRVHTKDTVYNGLTNIGVKPTVGAGNAAGAETYLYDFDGDLYGAEVTIELLSFMRKEQKFASVDELKEQLARDIAEGALL